MTRDSAPLHASNSVERRAAIKARHCGAQRLRRDLWTALSKEDFGCAPIACCKQRAQAAR